VSFPPNEKEASVEDKEGEFGILECLRLGGDVGVSGGIETCIEVGR